MMPTANPDELEAQARRLRAEATALEQAMARFDREARGAGWQGIAATQFKNGADDGLQAARGQADDLRAAANALDAGAGQIRRYLAALRSGSTHTR
jgi:uncharacterized protein YukE